MELMTVDPRSLKNNPDTARQSKSSPQSDALLCASIKAIGVVQPPVVKLDPEGGNSYIIVFGHRRAAQAMAAELAEIPVLVADPGDDLGAMQSFAENIAREPLIPSINGAPLNGGLRSAGPRNLSRLLWPYRAGRSASCGCSPTFCPRC
jgi:ParB family chromosome partitioning protein